MWNRLFSTNRNKRPPLRQAPLRQAGQSLEEDFFHQFLMKLGLWVMLPIIYWVIAGIDWMRWYQQSPPRPVINTVFASIVTIIAIFQIRKRIVRLMAVRQGIEGERYLGQYLEAFRQWDFRSRFLWFSKRSCMQCSRWTRGSLVEEDEGTSICLRRRAKIRVHAALSHEPPMGRYRKSIK